MQTDYYTRFAHNALTAGALPRFNTCMDPLVDAMSVCNGRGSCMPFNPDNVEHPNYFCLCQDRWGGPECAIERKRQSIAWALSMFGGPLALDEIYLGNTPEAIAKLGMTGIAAVKAGLGFRNVAIAILVVPWLLDVVRIGSAPVHAANYRVANDLPNWAFAVFTVLHFVFIAFALSLQSIYNVVTERRTLSDQKSYGAFTKILV